MSTSTSSKLRGNILSLYVVQILNQVFPLAILPYLLQTLGPTSYGSLAFSQALIAYAIVVTDFGFGLSATRAVSIARTDNAERTRIFWSTFAAKTLLLLLMILVVGLSMVAVPVIRSQWEVVAACGLAVVGSVLIPVWYLQGIERLNIVALAYLAARLVTLIGIFTLVRSTDDIVPAAVLLSIPQLLAAPICFLAIRRFAPVRAYRPSLSDVREAIGSSWYLFVSTAATTIYVNGNAFFLGVICGNYAVGLYAVANKTALAVFSLLAPLMQALFPRSNLAFENSHEAAKDFVWKLAVIVLPMSFLLSMGLFFTAHGIVTVVAGEEYLSAVNVLKAMAILPVILTLGLILSQFVMINLDLSSMLSKIYLCAGALSVMLTPLLAAKWDALGAALSLVVVESLSVILMLSSVRRVGFFKTSLP